MAENLRTLRTRIRTAQNIAQLARTLEMVSVSKIRRARARMDAARPYAERVAALTEAALRGVSPRDPVHPYTAARTGTGRILLVIGPDKGLCGPLPGNLVRLLAERMDGDTRVVTVGRRMEAPAARLAGNRLEASFPIGGRLPEYPLVYELSRLVDAEIMSGRASRLDVLSTRFVSFYSQMPALQRLLPLEPPAGPEDPAPPVFEPGRRAALEALLPRFLEVRLYDALVQAYAAEHAARMTAMQNAKSNAVEIADTFTLLYNKTRQERITSEILDLANKGKRRK